MSDEILLKLLLNTFLEMVKIHSTEPGNCSHMLAHHTEFIRRQIAIVLKRLEKK